MSATKMVAPMIECSECQTPYVARYGISLMSGEYRLAWYPDCKHRGKRPAFQVRGGDDPEWFDATKLGIITSRRAAKMKGAA